MKDALMFDRIKEWYRSNELFVRPSRLLPGRWRLFEYYSEPEGRLVNIKEHQLKREKLYWEIVFEPQGHFKQSSNLPVQFFKGSVGCNWHTSRNFIVVTSNDDEPLEVEFQFAVVKGNLKLLKKDHSGKIEFFGFFRKIVAQ